MFEFGTHNFEKIKTAVHIAQAVVIFIAWAITIAFFRSSADIDGRTGWYFAVCFLSIPAIIYPTLTPRFARSRKFANPYAFALLDCLFVVLWLSAFAAVAAFDADGKCKKDCSMGSALVALGVFICLFFIVTSIMSLYAMMYFRRNGTMPGARIPPNAERIDPDKAAFSTAPDDYAPVHGNDIEADPVQSGGSDVHDPYAEHAYESSSYAAHDTNTSYNGSTYGGNSTYGGYQEHDQEHVSDAMNYGGAPIGRVHFPPANYE